MKRMILAQPQFGLWPFHLMFTYTFVGLKTKTAAVHSKGVAICGKLFKIRLKYLEKSSIIKHLGNTRCHLFDELQNLKNMN